MSDNDTLLEEIKEQERMQRDGVNAYIEGISQELLRNDGWKTFKPAEIAEESLQSAIRKVDPLVEVEQTHRFRQFVSIATNFSSLTFAEKLHKIPELVESIKRLIENMMNEVKEYADMANEFRDLIQCFVRIVTQAKHNINMMLPLLTAAKTQMTIIQDVMSIEPSQSVNEIDKNDIQLALNQMSIGITKLLDLAKSSTAESQKLDERIHNTTNSVQSKKAIVEERIEIANFCFKYGIPVGGVAAGGTVGSLVVAESFGGIGVLVIARTAFPPVTAIVGACLLGGACAGTAIILVKKFWARHQLKALGYLNQTFEGLVELNSSNMYFMGYMADIEETANKVSQHLDDIQLCLLSERQRRANRNICTETIHSTTAMIESLERISNLDISQWTDTKNIVSFSKTKYLTN